jgi:diguanylate cyclase (GGDEF)-like protein
VLVAGILHDVTDSKRDEQLRVETLEEVANVDRLTGLHNLRGFDLVAEQAIAQAQRAGQGIGLIFCDMDGLKSINDAFGHAQGDRALQDATSILKFTLRNADAIARIGGDEFVVLALGGDSQSVLSLNERLQEGFEFFNSTNERPYQLSMSAGTAWCEPGGPCSLEALKATADAEMYAEKARRGRPAKVAPSPAE